jgi:hypothetical protein
MITGVSRFSKTSIFSDLNHLSDITMAEEFASICGIPIECLEQEFGDHITNTRSLPQFHDVENIYDEILAWYDGYSWDGVNRLINPFALLRFFEQEAFESFWFASGSPKFLIDLLKDKTDTYLSLKNMCITEQFLDSFDLNRIAIEALLFQTGYLTVKTVQTYRGVPQYTLDIPNFEVRDALNSRMLEALTDSGDARANTAQIAMRNALEQGDLETVLLQLRSLFSSIPYQLHVSNEAYYHSIFYAVMTVLGFDIAAEVSASRGRVDAVLELQDKVYVMELKYANCEPDASLDTKRALFDKTLDEAMAQIRDKGYSDKYKGSGKTIHEVGFAFLGRDQIEMRSLMM